MSHRETKITPPEAIFMNHTTALATAVSAVQSVGHTTDAEWLLVAVPLLVLALASAALAAFGEAGPHRFPLSLPARASSSLERLTGLPGWSAGGFALQSWAIIIAGL